MIPPLDEPVAKTFVGSAPYFPIVYFTILTTASESPPPLCVSVALLAASQQLKSCVALG